VEKIELTTGAVVSAVVRQILLVEDEPDWAEEIRSVLVRAGYEVRVAGDGGLAQSMFVARRPDVVLLDLILPGESGFEILQQFKHVDASVPVVIVSAIRLGDALRLAERLGADAYVVKPFEPDELLHAIRTVGDRRWRQALEPQATPTDRIHFACRCGKRFRVSLAHAGKTMSCPQCGDAITVPRST
jgi:DNA-binding response OmpR family regulator